jgi:hypothetical protein
MKLRPFSRIFGLVLLADGVTALTSPREYLRSLQKGTPIIDDLLEFFAQNPELTRKFSIAEIAAGLWLTFRP